MEKISRLQEDGEDDIKRERSLSGDKYSNTRRILKSLHIYPNLKAVLGKKGLEHL